MAAWIGPAIAAAASLVGSRMNQLSAQRNNAFQKEYAQNQIQWRVKDAKAAGIHPLYALGAPSVSPTLQSTSMGSGVAAAGQAIGQGISQYQQQKQAAEQQKLQTKILNEQYRKLRLENDATRMQMLGSVFRQAEMTRTGQGKSRPAMDLKPTLKGHRVKPLEESASSHVPLHLPFGIELKRPPGRTSAQSLEDELGEGASIPLGVLGLVEAAGYTIYDANQDRIQGLVDSVVSEFRRQGTIRKSRALDELRDRHPRMYRRLMRQLNNLR